MLTHNAEVSREKIHSWVSVDDAVWNMQWMYSDAGKERSMTIILQADAKNIQRFNRDHVYCHHCQLFKCKEWKYSVGCLCLQCAAECKDDASEVVIKRQGILIKHAMFEKDFCVYYYYRRCCSNQRKKRFTVWCQWHMHTVWKSEMMASGKTHNRAPVASAVCCS